MQIYFVWRSIHCGKECVGYAPTATMQLISGLSVRQVKKIMSDLLVSTIMKKRINKCTQFGLVGLLRPCVSMRSWDLGRDS